MELIPEEPGAVVLVVVEQLLRQLLHLFLSAVDREVVLLLHLLQPLDEL